MTWFTLWLAFVVVCVGVPLLYAHRQANAPVAEVAPLPEARGRQRPAPDRVEAHDMLAARLRMLAAMAAIVAVGWLLFGLSR